MAAAFAQGRWLHSTSPLSRRTYGAKASHVARVAWARGPDWIACRNAAMSSGLAASITNLHVSASGVRTGLTHEISGISTRGIVSDMAVRGRPRTTHQRLV